MNRHELYSLEDFTSEEITSDNQLAMDVLVDGLDVCKKCGAYEAALDKPCQPTEATAP